MKKIAKTLILKLKTIKHFLLGTSIYERHFRSRDKGDVRMGFDNISLPHREWLASQILDKQKNPIKILEIGCGWGPNLAVLSRINSKANLTGIDISPASINEGRLQIKKLGFKNIILIEMSVDKLDNFSNSSFDVVFSDATLLYVGPDKINHVIREMLRVAKSRVVILEMHIDQGKKKKDLYTEDGWVRDYGELLREIVGGNCVKVEKIPSGLRESGRWPIFGSVISIDLENLNKLDNF